MPAPEVCDPMHVNINPYALSSAPSSAHAQISHLGPDAREADESFNGIRDVAIKLVTEDESCGFDILCLVIVEADDVDHFIEAHWVDIEDVREREPWEGKFSLEAAHCDCVGSVFGLRREHKCYESLEALVLCMIRHCARIVPNVSLHGE